MLCNVNIYKVTTLLDTPEFQGFAPENGALTSKLIKKGFGLEHSIPKTKPSQPVKLPNINI
nr:MAG TPA: hypothetical protein [Caudoviricetes sp.]DAM19757.1 MAG TPA: hypothetical protein [Caudoviricetes sp.]